MLKNNVLRYFGYKNRISFQMNFSIGKQTQEKRKPVGGRAFMFSQKRYRPNYYFNILSVRVWVTERVILVFFYNALNFVYLHLPHIIISELLMEQ